MQVDVLESLAAVGSESLAPGMHFYTREYGWCVAAEVDIPPADPMIGSTEPSTITLAEPKGDVTALRFAPGAAILIAFPAMMPDQAPAEPPVEEPPAEPTFHTVWRDAETGEYVTEEYAAEHPDTTVSEQVPD